MRRLSTLSHDLAGTTRDVTWNGVTYNPASQLLTITRNNDAAVYPERLLPAASRKAWTGATNATTSYTANGLNQYSAATGARS